MLVEYLTGEEGGPQEQISAAQISRLIIAGDSLAPMMMTTKGESLDEGRKGVSCFPFSSVFFYDIPIEKVWL
jgi:DNA polymerase delta subunit 2